MNRKREEQPASRQQLPREREREVTEEEEVGERAAKEGW